jgi:hypothetical protein
MLLDDPKGEGVLVGILSSETEDSISRKFERSSGHVAQVAAGHGARWFSNVVI